MSSFKAVVTAARLLAESTGLSLKSAVTSLAFKAEVLVGIFFRFFFVADDASVAEESAIRFDKTLTEPPSIQDNDTLDYLKIAGDFEGQTYCDAGYFLEEYIEGPQIDRINMADDDTLAIDKKLSESPSLTDLDILEIVKPQSDSMLIDDLDTLILEKPFTELPSANDDDILSVEKIAGDNTNQDYSDPSYFSADYLEGSKLDRAFAFENNVIDLTKILTDRAFVTDDIDGEASTEDDQEIAFVKTRTDIGVVSETFDRTVVYLRDFTENGSVDESEVKLVTKFRSDSGAVSDSGDLRSQGYCDFTYFAEDYVGASRTFT